jgi:hypothetical protein
MGILVAVVMQAVNLLFNAFLSPVLVVMGGAAVTALIQMRSAPRHVPQPLATPAVPPAPQRQPRYV